MIGVWPAWPEMPGRCRASPSSTGHPRSYWTTWGGAFEQRQSATKRLQIVVPVSLLLVFVLLFTMFGNIKDGLLVFTGVPFALTGGFVALWLRGIPLPISAGVGFIALSGVAVLTGLVMIAAIRSLREDGLPLDRAIHEAKSDTASDRSGARLEIRRLIAVSAVPAMKPAQVGNRTNRCQCPCAAIARTVSTPPIEAIASTTWRSTGLSTSTSV